MESIISLLLAHIQVLNNQIKYLLFFIAKNIPLTSKPNDWNSPKYNKLKVDKLPIINPLPEKKNYKEIISRHLVKTGKLLSPVSRRKKSSVPSSIHCPCCNAPAEYLYDNNGGCGQFECKLCKTKFNEHNYASLHFKFSCPHCGKPLSTNKERKVFTVHRCRNPKCSFYLHNLNSLSKEDLEEFHKHSERFKLHYIYREFTTDFFKIDLLSIPKGASSLIFRKFSPHIMGLALTYLVNCGLSTRKTAFIMHEVHGVKISHAQIASYATSAAFCVKSFVDTFDYKPTTFLAADETYTKIKGIKQYAWFIMDVIKKSILGYYSSDSRDVGPCIIAMRMAFAKFKEFPR